MPVGTNDPLVIRSIRFWRSPCETEVAYEIFRRIHSQCRLVGRDYAVCLSRSCNFMREPVEGCNTEHDDYSRPNCGRWRIYGPCGRKRSAVILGFARVLPCSGHTEAIE